MSLTSLLLSLLGFIAGAQALAQVPGSGSNPSLPTALAAAEDERTAQRLAAELRETLGEPWTPRIDAAALAPKLTGRAQLRQAAADRDADLLLLRHPAGYWRAVPVRAGVGKRFGAGLPPEALVQEEAIGVFLEAWAAQQAGFAEPALERFAKLAKTANRSPNPDLTRLWHAAALAWAGDEEAAESKLREARESNLRENDEMRGSMALLLGGLLARRAPNEAAAEAGALLAEAAKTTAKSWPGCAGRAKAVQAQLDLALAPRPFRADDLERRIRDLNEAAKLLDAVRDEAAWAAAQVELGLAHGWLAQREGAGSEHAAIARQRLVAAKTVWRRRNDEGAAEAVGHILRGLVQ